MEYVKWKSIVNTWLNLKKFPPFDECLYLYVLELKKKNNAGLSVCLSVRLSDIRPSVYPVRMHNNFWRS